MQPIVSYVEEPQNCQRMLYEDCLQNTFKKKLTRAQDSGEIGLLLFKHSIEYLDYKVIIKKIIFVCVCVPSSCMHENKGINIM